MTASKLSELEPVHTAISTEYGDFELYCFGDEPAPNIALVVGNIKAADHTMLRIQSECFTGHVLHSLSCDCGEQLIDSINMIQARGSGIVIYLRQEGRGIGLRAKIESYNLQKKGFDTVEANIELGFEEDPRAYSKAADILSFFDVKTIDLITNNPKKKTGLEKCGIFINEIIAVAPKINEKNIRYLKTKRDKMGHLFDI